MTAIESDDIMITEKDNLDVYVIGYNYQGESIVVSIGNNKFVGVIDCYRTKDSFITRRILEKLNVKRIDFLCWTHIDWDHTKGISQLKKYINKDTTIILPEGMSFREIHNIMEHFNIKTCYEKEFKRIYNMIEKVDPDYRITVNQTSNIFEFNLIFMGSKKRYRFKMDVFAPISSVISNCMDNTLKQFYNSINIEDGIKKLNKDWYIKLQKHNNLYSIGLKIIISSENDRISICLCGDLDNETINKMNDKKRNKIFNNNTLVKIPHHCSKNADALFELKCINKFKYGVTTSFRYILPDSDMIDKYKNKCTSISRTNNEKTNLNKYGVVIYQIPLIDLIPLAPIYKGDACMCK